MNLSDVVWYILTGAMSVFGTLAFFFFKSYLAKIEHSFTTLNMHLERIEITLKEVNNFITRQDEKNANQTMRDAVQDNNIIELTKRVSHLEKQVSNLENRIKIVEKEIE